MCIRDRDIRQRRRERGRLRIKREPFRKARAHGGQPGEGGRIVRIEVRGKFPGRGRKRHERGRMQVLFENEIRSGGDGRGHLFPGGGKRRGEAGHGQRGLVPLHEAVARDRQLGVGFAQRENVLGVAEEIRPRCEIPGRR